MFLPKRLRKLLGVYPIYSSENPPPPPRDGRWISYASNCEDVYLNRCFSSPGFYIDIGANHPYEGSVTKHLYDQGWRGINIEPHSQMFALLMRDRPRDINLNCGVGSSKSELTFFETKVGGYSSFIQSIAQERESTSRVVCVEPLNDICHRYNVQKIDFLKIDVEGAEKDVLRGFDLLHWRPSLMAIEATYPGTSTPSFSEWENSVLESGYERVLFDGVNAWYIAPEALQLKEKFSLPPNVWDNFIPDECWRFSCDIARLRR